MLNSLTTYLDSLKGERTPPFSLEMVANFPVSEFSELQTHYGECEFWYSGDALDETVTVSDKPTELYPVKINPLKGQVLKHAHFLFGEVPQNERPLVFPRVIPKSDDESDRKAAEKAEDVLHRIWWESNGRSIQWENGARSQIYGGCIFKISYDKMDPLRSIPFRIENPHPKFFVGRPSANDMYRLREAWLVRPISPDEALENGVTLEEDADGWLVEHWTETRYEAQINNRNVARQLQDGTWLEVSGANPWGFVPIVYIPHIRVTGFYGEDDILHVTGLIKEINARVADYGDAVNVDSHSYVGMRNVTGTPRTKLLAPNLTAIDLGSSQALTGNEAEPDLFDIRQPAASDSMENLVNLLYAMYRRVASLPGVVDGEDEGSQRSGLTLAMRMIALTAHIDTERVFWSNGLDRLARMLLIMCQIKGVEGISDAMAKLMVKQDWAPQLPRDREMVVQEAVALIGAKLGSPERLLEVLGVDNVGAERDLILKFWKELTEMESKAQQKFNPPQGPASKPGQPAPAQEQPGAPSGQRSSAQENQSTE